MQFQNVTLEQFWCTKRKTFPRLAKATLQILMPFACICLCKVGVSSLLIKTNATNCLNVTDGIHAASKKMYNEVN